VEAIKSKFQGQASERGRKVSQTERRGRKKDSIREYIIHSMLESKYSPALNSLHILDLLEVLLWTLPAETLLLLLLPCLIELAAVAEV
jgi:hypothetical protein